MITSHDGYHRYDARNAPAQHRRPLLCCESNGLAGAVRGFGARTPPTDAAQAVGNTLPLTPPRTVPLPTFVFAICCRAPPLPPLPALPRTQTNPSPVECRQGYVAGVRQGEPCDGVEWGDDVVCGMWNGKWGAVCIISHTHIRRAVQGGETDVRGRECAKGGAHLEDGGRALWCPMHLDTGCGAAPLLSLCHRKPTCHRIGTGSLPNRQHPIELRLCDFRARRLVE